MLFPQAMLVIFKFLDYLDSGVIEELRFPFSLWSLTMKGQSSRKPLPPTPHPSSPSQEAGGPPLPPQLSETQCKHSLDHSLDSGLCSFLSNVFQAQSPSHLIRNLGHSLFYSQSLCIFLKSHTQYTDSLPRLSKFPHPWYRAPKVSFVLSGVMNVLKGQTASPHILKRKITEISNGIGDISWFSLAFVIY